MTGVPASGPASSARESAPFREIDIDLDALAANVARFRELTDGAPLFVDLGADAWGHGLEAVAPALVALGAQAFTVARLEEARRLRALAPEPLIVTTQHAADEDFARAAALNVAPLVRSTEEYVRAVAAGVTGVVFAEDQGTGIPGLGVGELALLGDDAEKRGIAALLDTSFPVIGAELLGVSEQPMDAAPEFRPVLRLWAPVAAVKRVGPDEGVSYGYIHRTRAGLPQSTLALVTLGYADGLDRAAGNTGEVVVDGRPRTRIAGRVAMDAFMVDLGDAEPPRLGVRAVVLGDAERGEPTAFELAEALGTVSAEITTRLSARPRRRAVGGPVADTTDTAGTGEEKA